MKKLIYISFVLFSVNTYAQQSWRWGVQWAATGNSSSYSGGTPEASALFQQTDYGACSLGLTGRYFFDEHWSLQSGFNFNEIGFEYNIAKDYSLLNLSERYATNRITIPVFQVPLTALYNFNYNCKNRRWFIGAGLLLMNSFDNQSKSSNTSFETIEESRAATKTSDHLDQNISSEAFSVATGQLMFGIEKLCKHGNIFQFGMIINKGFTELATSTVSYSVNNKQYQHSFTNSGSYCGLMLNYYFKSHPVKKRSMEQNIVPGN